MRIDTLRRAIHVCREAGITSYIHGHKGIGKSSTVRDLALTGKMGFVDLRCSQIEASDLRGLPDKVNGRTTFLPPADMPSGGKTWDDLSEVLGFPAEEYETRLAKLKESGSHQDLAEATRIAREFTAFQPLLETGYLFLDELNRAQDDVLNAVFQLVLDQKIGQYVLPPGWSIVVAGNFMEGYTTGGFKDPAFLDRFCHLTLSADDTTMPEWIQYLCERHGPDASRIVEFASQNLKHLHGDLPKSDLGFSVNPSPRSWEAVVRVEKVFKNTDLGADAKQAVIAGLVGWDLARSYESYSCPIKPADLIRDGIERHMPVLQKLQRNELQGLVWGLSGMIINRVESDEQIGTLAMDFARFLCKSKDRDLGVAFVAIMLGVNAGTKGQQQLRQAIMVNPKIGNLIRKMNSGRKSFAMRLVNDPDLSQLVGDTAMHGGQP